MPIVAVATRAGNELMIPVAVANLVQLADEVLPVRLIWLLVKDAALAIATAGTAPSLLATNEQSLISM